MAVAFSCNPIIPGQRPGPEAWELLNSAELDWSRVKVLPLCQGKPLIVSYGSQWQLAWRQFADCDRASGLAECGEGGARREDLVYLGEDQGGRVYCALNVLPDGAAEKKLTPQSIARSLSSGEDEKVAFVDLRTLMVACEEAAMGELSIAGHARALLEWHSQVRFCGRCGCKTEPCDAGQRRRCSNASCRCKAYPRTDPVVIMLIIDKEQDRVLLAHQPKYVPRMWSCIAGFIEPGESLEEAVRRETKEETGVDVGEVVYYSSQPWPAGPSNMSCQLMMGFFGLAKTYDVKVDKKELEDARWFTRSEVQDALTSTDYEETKRAASSRVLRMCSGENADPRGSASLSLNRQGSESGICVPGPYAIAHHLISAWATQGLQDLLSRI